MATETEVSLNVEDFFGINSQVTSEDLRDQFYLKSQNLYERKLGEIQPIGGMADAFSVPLPSNVNYVGKPFTLKDRFTGRERMAHVRCIATDPADGALAAPNLAITFGANGTGTWGETIAIPNAYLGATAIKILGTGFGFYRSLTPASTGALPVAGDSKQMVLTISSAFADQNITGLEIYARVINGYIFGAPNYTWMFVGSVDLLRFPSGSFAFNRAPITLGADPGVTETGLGSAVFSLTGTTGGILTPGKTYYVSCMSQHLKYTAPSGSEAVDRKCYYKNSVITAITLGPTDTAINVNLSSQSSASTVVAIGTSPQTMKVAGIIPVGVNLVTRIPENAAHVNLIRTGAGTFLVVFNQSIYYRDEFFARFDFTYNRWRPVYISKNAGNKSALSGYGLQNSNIDQYFKSIEANPYWERAFVNRVVGTKVYSDSVSSYGDWSSVQYSAFGSDLMFLAARSAEDDYTFNSVTYASTDVSALDDFDANTSAAQKLYQTDGFIAGRVIPDWDTAETYENAVPPKGSFIVLFKESLATVGGPGDGYNRVYFAQPLSPYKWGSPHDTRVAQFVQVETGGEGVNGAGIYTNTTGTSGPVAQLVISKPNSLWLLTDFPVYTSTTINEAVMTQLSGEVGSAGHETFQNTDIGLMCASIKGVWLIRESGEPTPIGEEVKNLLIDENPALQLVNTRYWHAVYHDGHYKLAYSEAGALNPTKELWLNISKMKQMKGQPCWNGPHTARSANGLRFSYNEGQFKNQIVPVRVGTTGLGLQWATMDDPSVPANLGTNMTYIFETRDYPLGNALLNKIFTRSYWRMKIDSAMTVTELTTVLNEAGEQTETQSLAFAPIASHSGGTYATFLAARQKLYQFFPVLRLRGETIRKKITYTGTARFSISGITLGFRPEGRRIG